MGIVWSVCNAGNQYLVRTGTRAVDPRNHEGWVEITEITEDIQDASKEEAKILSKKAKEHGLAKGPFLNLRNEKKRLDPKLFKEVRPVDRVKEKMEKDLENLRPPQDETLLQAKPVSNLAVDNKDKVFEAVLIDLEDAVPEKAEVEPPKTSQVASTIIDDPLVAETSKKLANVDEDNTLMIVGREVKNEAVINEDHIASPPQSPPPQSPPPPPPPPPLPVVPSENEETSGGRPKIKAHDFARIWELIDKKVTRKRLPPLVKKSEGQEENIVEDASKKSKRKKRKKKKPGKLPIAAETSQADDDTKQPAAEGNNDALNTSFEKKNGADEAGSMSNHEGNAEPSTTTKLKCVAKKLAKRAQEAIVHHNEGDNNVQGITAASKPSLNKRIKTKLGREVKYLSAEGQRGSKVEAGDETGAAEAVEPYNKEDVYNLFQTKSKKHPDYVEVIGIEDDKEVLESTHGAVESSTPPATDVNEPKLFEGCKEGPSKWSKLKFWKKPETLVMAVEYDECKRTCWTEDVKEKPKVKRTWAEQRQYKANKVKVIDIGIPKTNNETGNQEPDPEDEVGFVEIDLGDPIIPGMVDSVPNQVHQLAPRFTIIDDTKKSRKFFKFNNRYGRVPKGNDAESEKQRDKLRKLKARARKLAEDTSIPISESNNSPKDGEKSGVKAKMADNLRALGNRLRKSPKKAVCDSEITSIKPGNSSVLQGVAARAGDCYENTSRNLPTLTTRAAKPSDLYRKVTKPEQ